MPWFYRWQGSKSNSINIQLSTLLSWLLLYGLCPVDSSQTAAAAATAAGVQLGMPKECSTPPTDLRIPRIIHRNYMEGRSAMYAATQVENPSWQLHWLLSCKAHHPSWAEMVWSEEDILGLIHEEYPWFLSTYQTYPKHVFRSDLARFVILHKHGGVYLDADVECYKNMEPSLAGLDLVINCRTYDVAHNAAMASIVGHPVWIQAMKAAMAVVQRLSPVVSSDPLTATGPVLMSQTVQQFYGISKEQFCDRLHVKDGLVLKAYPKGQWFTPCWPWANLLCYKKLEAERKFVVRTQLKHVVGVHHYSGTWTGQASSSKDKLRQHNRMLAAAATVRFIWDSPHFLEYQCSPTAAGAGVDNSTVALNRSSGGGSLQQRLVHKRPGLVSAAETKSTASAVVRRLRRMLGAQQHSILAAAVAVAGPAAAAAATVEPQAVESPPVSHAAVPSILSCPAVHKLASLQPCMVLSFMQATPMNQSAIAGLQTSDAAGSICDSRGNNCNSSSMYWANVDGMLSTFQRSLGCHVTVASSADASIPAKLPQLASIKVAAQSTEPNEVDWSALQLEPLWSTWQQGFETKQQPQQGSTAKPTTAAATFVEVGVAAAASPGMQQGPDAAQLLARMLQQQRDQHLHALGCDGASAKHRFPATLTCKAPPRHTVLHVSCRAEFLLDLAEQMYSYNAQVGHAAFEQHGRYAGAMHTSPHDQPSAASSSSSAKLHASFSNGSLVESAQSVITLLDTVDILLVDVERPSGQTAHRQGWSTWYNLLYQLHGHLGFHREALPDGRTRLGWIRRPERLARSACSAPH